MMKFEVTTRERETETKDANQTGKKGKKQKKNVKQKRLTVSQHNTLHHCTCIRW